MNQLLRYILVAIPLSSVLMASAQTDSTDTTEVPFKNGYVQESLFYPVGTSWKKSKQKNYFLSINVLYGNVGSVGGLQVGLVNRTQRDVKGLEIGGVNLVKRNSYGIQAGLLVNVNQGNGVGMQLSGLWSHNTGNYTGFQFSWFGNTNWGNAYGGQLSHLWNHANKNMYGIQFALGLNMARYDAFGIQMSATVNVAGRKHKGVQFGFLANYAGESEGIQFGMVNIAKKSGGLQIGLVNYSGDSSVATIGLINIVKGGYNKLEIWGGEMLAFNAALKTGGEKLYSVINIGTNPINLNKFWAIGWGFGTHMQFTKRFYADIDQITSLVSINEPLSMGAGKTTILNQIRFMAGFSLTKKVALFIGPVWNTLISDNNTLHDSRTGLNTLNGTDLAPTFRTFLGQIEAWHFAIWPGIGGGIRFF